MDSELRQYLEEMEGRLTQRADGMEAHLTRLTQQADEMEARLRAHTSQECEKVETSLLTEFWKWGRTSELRTRQSMETMTTINERLLNAEDRISALERRRIPPHADAA